MFKVPVVVAVEVLIVAAAAPGAPDGAAVAPTTPAAAVDDSWHVFSAGAVAAAVAVAVEPSVFANDDCCTNNIVRSCIACRFLCSVRSFGDGPHASPFAIVTSWAK